MKKIHLRFLLFILLFLSQLDNQALMLVPLIPIIIYLIISNNSFCYFKELAPFINIFFIPALIGFLAFITYTDRTIYNYLRDISYFIQAPVYLYFGYILIRQVKLNQIDLVKLIVISVTTLSILNLIKIPFQLPSLSSLGMFSRYEFYFHNNFALLSFMIIFNYRFLGLRLFNRKIDNFILFISLLSILISFSRTSYILLIIVILVPYLNRHASKVMFFLLLFVIGNLFLGEIIPVSSYNTGESSFISKFNNSFSEIVIREMNDQQTISFNWRGYESYLGLQKYLEGNVIELIFGQGFGAKATTPFWVFDGEFLNELPVFHNGFITILLKAGLLGLLFFLYFLFQLTRLYHDKFNLTPERLCKVSLGFIIYSSTLVTHGVFYKQAPFLTLFLLGLLCSVTNQKTKS